MLNNMQHRQLEGAEQFKDAAIERMATDNRPTYPGYPATRLFMETFVEDIPDGPWELNPGEIPSRSETQLFRDLGLAIDSRGRPLHPWLKEMVTNPRIGVLAGRGFYWNWGPNQTADPIIIRHDLAVPHALLIDRGDTGEKAFAGGFVNPGELAVVAAAREALEEALFDPSGFPVRQVYDGPLSDTRATAHAWSHTTAFRFDVPNDVARNLPLGRYKGGDDAAFAEWLPVNNINGRLFGSHNLLLKLALEMD